MILSLIWNHVRHCDVFPKRTKPLPIRHLRSVPSSESSAKPARDCLAAPCHYDAIISLIAITLATDAEPSNVHLQSTTSDNRTTPLSNGALITMILQLARVNYTTKVQVQNQEVNVNVPFVYIYVFFFNVSRLISFLLYFPVSLPLHDGQFFNNNRSGVSQPHRPSSRLCFCLIHRSSETQKYKKNTNRTHKIELKYS